MTVHRRGRCVGAVWEGAGEGGRSSARASSRRPGLELPRRELRKCSHVFGGSSSYCRRSPARGSAALGVTVTSSPAGTLASGKPAGPAPSATSTRLPAALSALLSRYHLSGKKASHSDCASPRPTAHGRDAMADDVTWEADLRLGCRSVTASVITTATRRGRDSRRRTARRLPSQRRLPASREGGSHLPASHVGGIYLPSSVAGQVWRGIQAGSSTARSGVSTATRSFRSHRRPAGRAPPIPSVPRRARSFRIVALSVKGKTVVLFLDNISLPAERFHAFIASANRLLRSVTFAWHSPKERLRHAHIFPGS